MANKRPETFPGIVTDVFFEMPCLTEFSSSLDGQTLRRTWFRSLDKRYVAQGLQKFISYNREWFKFLEVEPIIYGFDQNASLRFRSTSVIGAIPLRAPDTGKQIGDFVVTPRFVGQDRFGSYIEILDLLGKDISPEFRASIPLASGRIFRPPMYLEAAKFIISVEELLKRPWRKFNNAEFLTQEPTGQIDWSKYATKSYRVENRLLFPSKRSVLNEFHEEFREIRFVFDICRDELSSASTPKSIRDLFRSRLRSLEERLYFHLPKPISQLKIRAADSPLVKRSKHQANKILEQRFVDGTAWRVDFNDVFEKFVQHIFLEVSRAVGGRLHSNLRIPAQSNSRYAWELNNLEPDAVIQWGEMFIAIDAKYKSHLFNKYESTDLLKSEFRRDLHQILGYSTFSGAAEKLAILCYPSSRVEAKTTIYRTGVGNASVKLIIAGIPLEREVISEAVTQFSCVLTSLNSAP